MSHEGTKDTGQKMTPVEFVEWLLGRPLTAHQKATIEAVDLNMGRYREVARRFGREAAMAEYHRDVRRPMMVILDEEIELDGHR